MTISINTNTVKSKGIKVTTDNLYGNFQVSDIDESGDPKYYGFINNKGAWYILKDTGGTTFRYIKGDTNYTTNWTSRSGLTYDYFYNIF